jgi:hypothetical protein
MAADSGEFCLETDALWGMLQHTEGLDKDTIDFADGCRLPEVGTPPHDLLESDDTILSFKLNDVTTLVDGTGFCDVGTISKPSSVSEATAVIPGRVPPIPRTAHLPLPPPTGLLTFGPRSSVRMPSRSSFQPLPDCSTSVLPEFSPVLAFPSPTRWKRSMPANPCVSPIFTPVNPSAVADSQATAAVKCLIHIREKMNPTGSEVVEVWKGLQHVTSTPQAAQVAGFAALFKAQKKYTVRKLAVLLLQYFCESDATAADAISRTLPTRKKRKHHNTLLKERFVRDVLGVSEDQCPHLTEGKMLVDHCLALLEAMAAFNLGSLHIPALTMPTARRAAAKKLESI